MLVTNLVNFKLFIMKYTKKERKKKKTINLQVHWVEAGDTQYKFNALTSNWENPNTWPRFFERWIALSTK